MIGEIMDHLNNHFEIRGGSVEGEFVIKNGSIDLPFLLEGQYFWIKDSVLNDGVYQYPAYELSDERFNGTIIPLKVPRDFIETVYEIEKWQKDNGAKLDNMLYQSESFNGYSYTKAFGSDYSEAPWMKQFNGRLKRWRKLKCL